MDLAAYRVVQEALTNAIKHASAAPTEVTVRWEPEHLELEIVDNGARARNGSSGGHGLVGMEERVRLYDGELRAGHRAGGGFEVSLGCHCDPGPDRRRPGARARRLPHDPRRRGGHQRGRDASDGAEAVEQTKRLDPDVVLMDIRMPELDGIESTRRVIANGGDSPPRVLMLTTFDLNEYVNEALRAGASGFLLKDVPPEELTAREVEVFKLVARGMSNAEIAAELVVSETTVKTHVARLLMKLSIRDRVQAVVLAYESGIAVPGGTE